MRSVDAIPNDCAIQHPERAISPPTMVNNGHYVEISTLASLSDQHRITKTIVKINQQMVIERKKSYQEAVHHILDRPS